VKRRRALLLAATTLAALVASACGAGGSANQGGTYTPSGDVVMVVPFGAGGGSDRAGRAMASGLEGVGDGISVHVENRTGGSGAVGYSYFLGRSGDPEYLLAAETALLALPLSTQVEFDYTSFTPIMKVAEDFTLLVVSPTAPYQTCTDVVDAAKRERVVAGVAGATSLDNVVFRLVEQATGTSFDRVPFESGSEVLAALLGGQIDVASLNPGEVVGQLQAGELKALCAFSENRYDYPELKDIPTGREQGIDVAYAQFRGLIAPGEISEAATRYWIDAGRRFADSEAYRQYVTENYLQPTTAYGEEFRAYLERNNAELAKALGQQ
jgi:putative tricarboxylic transport membrane protein